MKMKTVLGLIAVASFSFGAQSFAASKLMSACKKDLKKHACKAKTDAEAHECLEKVEKHDAKDDGFTHACYEAHEAFEKASGKEEKNEHHDESTEQKQQ